MPHPTIPPLPESAHCWFDDPATEKDAEPLFTSVQMRDFWAQGYAVGLEGAEKAAKGEAAKNPHDHIYNAGALSAAAVIHALPRKVAG